MADGIYRTLDATSEGLYKEKGSKFISIACPVDSQEAAKEVIGRLRKQYHDARHHCYAYVLENESRNIKVFDDGEPKNSAGQPILRQIRSRKLSNTMVVVVRYFGGTLLGASRLANAYKTAASDALDKASIVRAQHLVVREIIFSYPDMDPVMQVIKEERLNILHQVTDNQCQVRAEIPASEADRVCTRLEILGCRTGKVDISPS